MSPSSPILVATDLSAPSRHAVDRAFRVAAATGAGLTVLHVLELDAIDNLSGLLGDGTTTLKQQLTDEAREALRQLVTDPAHHRDVTAEARVASGNPLETIAREADTLNADLLIVGARGASFLRHALLGATASRLLRKSVVRPVLVVKQAPHDAYRRMLVAVDFSPVSAQTVRLARRIAPGAAIVLVHVLELPFAFAGVDERVIQQYIRNGAETCRRRLHELARDADWAPTDYTAVVVHGDPVQQIVAQEQEQDCDLILLGKRGAHVTEDLLLGSVTKHVLMESQGDVLVVP